ncbi:MAG: hypothetical protein ACP5JJ_05875 [Anaerolineae bacterium]
MIGFGRVGRQSARHGEGDQEVLWARFQVDLKQDIHRKSDCAGHPLFRQRMIASDGLDAGIFRKADRNRDV